MQVYETTLELIYEVSQPGCNFIWQAGGAVPFLLRVFSVSGLDVGV
jgi:hypothetical protein